MLKSILFREILLYTHVLFFGHTHTNTHTCLSMCKTTETKRLPRIVFQIVTQTENFNDNDFSLVRL